MSPGGNESGREASCDAPDCQPGDILEYFEGKSTVKSVEIEVPRRINEEFHPL